jgi:hypothetical protein
MRAVQRSAAVVFTSHDGVSAALSQAGNGQIVEYELPPAEGPVGLKAWVAQHKALRPGNSILQQQVLMTAPPFVFTSAPPFVPGGSASKGIPQHADD